MINQRNGTLNTEHRKAQEKYEVFRREARAKTEDLVLSQMRAIVNLDSINAKELAIAKTWEFHDGRHPDFGYDWNKHVSKYVRRSPKHFDLSIRSHGVLCGLSIGKPTWAGKKMRIDVIEGSPYNHPLKNKIVTVTVAAFSAYARLIGASQIRIMEPINDGVTALYKRHGFTYQQGKGKVKTHLWMNL